MHELRIGPFKEFSLQPISERIKRRSRLDMCRQAVPRIRRGRRETAVAKLQPSSWSGHIQAVRLTASILRCP